jgi:hypothetical protein
VKPLAGIVIDPFEPEFQIAATGNGDKCIDQGSGVSDQPIAQPGRTGRGARGLSASCPVRSIGVPAIRR